MTERRRESEQRAVRVSSELREQVTQNVKKDPRREASAPAVWIAVLQELQGEMATLKTRLAKVESELAALRGETPASPPPSPSMSPTPPSVPSPLPPRHRESQRPTMQLKTADLRAAAESAPKK